MSPLPDMYCISLDQLSYENIFCYNIPQPLQRLIEKIDNHPKDGYCRGISTPELIRKHLSAELKKHKKMYEMIEGRNIDEDIRNTQAGKSAEVAGCSYSGYPPFCMAFVNANHYVVLHFKNFNGSIPIQSLGNDLKLFQKLMPSASGEAVINVD
ncbi:hypothetical protein BY996DRAFT_8395662 [Phakopsora pachyrhizi]|nr:hypothetical protein BY996DRAFT_8395662 [Phakopsora pachyrhizi]